MPYYSEERSDEAKTYILSSFRKMRFTLVNIAFSFREKESAWFYRLGKSAQIFYEWLVIEGTTNCIEFIQAIMGPDSKIFEIYPPVTLY